jgi:hypothetical protein
VVYKNHNNLLTMRWRDAFYCNAIFLYHAAS